MCDATSVITTWNFFYGLTSREEIAVESSQTVAACEPLLWIEAMKMETAVSPTRDGTLFSVLVGPGWRWWVSCTFWDRK